MTGFLKWGVGISGAVIAVVAMSATVAGMFDWSLGPVIALFGFVAGDIAWRVARKRQARERQQAELAAIAVTPRRRLVELDGRPDVRHAA